MRTYSHVVLAWAAQRALSARNVAVSRRYFLLGALAPDVALVALALGYFVCFRPLELAPDAEVLTYFDTLYRTHPVWITGHNLLHAPLLLGGALVGLRHLDRQGVSWAHRAWWFALGAALHSATDIVTHVDDGPLLLFPFEWTLRFASPVSYWDPNHYGAAFTVVEHLIDALIVWSAIRARPQAIATAPGRGIGAQTRGIAR